MFLPEEQRPREAVERKDNMSVQRSKAFPLHIGQGSTLEKPDEPKPFTVKRKVDLPFDSVKKPILLGIAIIIVISLIFSTVFTVPAGERGVQLHFGAVTGVIYDEGLNFKIPFVQKVDKMDVKILKIETGTSAASKDLQIVTTTIALNFRLIPERVAHIRQTIGKNYQPIIVDPAVGLLTQECQDCF